MTDQQATGSIIPVDDLEHSEHSHELVGAEHGDVPFCIILVHSKPGVGPELHRHPYPEVFVVDGGHVVVSPSGEAHGFTNTGAGQLRLTAIHGAGRFNTEWLSGDDPVWTSKPRG